MNHIYISDFFECISIQLIHTYRLETEPTYYLNLTGFGKKGQVSNVICNSTNPLAQEETGQLGLVAKTSLYGVSHWSTHNILEDHMDPEICHTFFARKCLMRKLAVFLPEDYL